VDYFHLGSRLNLQHLKIIYTTCGISCRLASVSGIEVRRLEFGVPDSCDSGAFGISFWQARPTVHPAGSEIRPYRSDCKSAP
jgi:hypothetical protein